MKASSCASRINLIGVFCKISFSLALRVRCVLISCDMCLPLCHGQSCLLYLGHCTSPSYSFPAFLAPLSFSRPLWLVHPIPVPDTFCQSRDLVYTFRCFVLHPAYSHVVGDDGFHSVHCVGDDASNVDGRIYLDPPDLFLPGAPNRSSRSPWPPLCASESFVSSPSATKS
jgi:hypothetical protein